MLNHAEESHYSNIQVDDRISQATLDNYLAALDPQRLFFTVEEEVRFREQYGDRLDDAMRQGQMEPVFEIHRLYLQRHGELRDFAQNYLKTLPNLNTSGEWLLDRSSGAPPRQPGRPAGALAGLGASQVDQPGAGRPELRGCRRLAAP